MGGGSCVTAASVGGVKIARAFFFCAGGVGGAAGDARNDVSEASGSFAWAGGRRDA